MLKEIKMLLDLDGDSKDQLLSTLISLKSRKLVAALGEDITKVPTALDYIVVELVVNHYNRLGSEGIASESIDSISKTYNSTLADELVPYESDISRYLDSRYYGKFRLL